MTVSGVPPDMNPRLLLPLVLAVVVASCGGRVDVSGDENAGHGSDAPTGSWQLVEGRGPDGPIPIPDDHAITLTFEDQGGIGGTAACNHYFGEVAIDGDAITISGVGQTEMGCFPQEVMDAERSYLVALPEVTTYEQTGDRLVLNGPDAELVYERLAPPPTAELTGTRWELDSLIHGNGPDGAVSSVMSEGHLVLHEDGTLTGSTGCRELTGEWVESADTIQATSLAADGECAADLRAQDAQVVEILERFRAEVDGQRLTLTSPDGSSGLGYRVAD